MSMSRQDLIAQQIAESSKRNVKVIRNTASNGADYYISAYEDAVFVYNTGSYTQDLFLPPVGETKGRKLYISFVDAGGTNKIYDNDDSYYPAWTDLTPDADADDVLLYNPDGRGWVVLFNGIA